MYVRNHMKKQLSYVNVIKYLALMGYVGTADFDSSAY